MLFGRGVARDAHRRGISAPKQPRATGRDTPKIIRFIIGNPLIMKEMAKHIPDAGSYAPVTVLVDERADGVHLSYDKMESLLAPYGNRDALEVARELDRKIERILQQAAA